MASFVMPFSSLVHMHTNQLAMKPTIANKKYVVGMHGDGEALSSWTIVDLVFEQMLSR